MCKFPNDLPKITITEVSKYGEVEYRQGLASFMEPKLGAKVSYAEYEVMKNNGLIVVNHSYIRGKAKIHGLECFENVSSYGNAMDDKKYEVISFDRVEENHIRPLAYIEEYPDGYRDFYTFKDKHFMEHWAQGENNVGMEINLKSRGTITCNEDNLITSSDKYGVYDIVGEYKVQINGKEFDTVRLVLMCAEHQISDFYIGKDGKEVMHRFFMPDDGFWGEMKDNTYSTQFPNAYTIKINNKRKCVCVKYVIPEYVI